MDKQSIRYQDGGIDGAMGCYSSIVTQTNVEPIDNFYEYMAKNKDKGSLASVYFTALGRERYGMYKTSNNAETLKSQFQ